MTSMEALLNKLEEHLRIGNFEKALPLARELDCHDLDIWLKQKELLDPERVRMVCSLSETDFYLSQNAKAWQRLEAYHPVSHELCELQSVSTQGKLQLAMGYHSQRNFADAVKFGQMVKEKCEESHTFNSYWNIGLCNYYLARFTTRQDRFIITERYCDQAVKFATQAGITLVEEEGREVLGQIGGQMEQMFWLMGRALLVKGHTAWLVGNFETGLSKLTPARFFLSFTRDFIHQANVAHGLGCVMSDRGQYQKALKAFDFAEKHYRNNIYSQKSSVDVIEKIPYLHLSRLYLHRGNANLANGIILDAKSEYDNSLKYADLANDQRQKAAAMTAISLLYLEDDYLDLVSSRKNLERATRILGKMENNKRSWLRAKIAYGRYFMKAREYDNAKNRFEIAIQDAEELGISHLQAFSYLLLAELYCTMPVRKLHEAKKCYEISQKILGNDFPYDIEKKRKEIYERIYKSPYGDFMISKEDLEKNELKPLVDKLRQWAFESTLERTKGNKAQAARDLGMTPAGLAKSLDRLDE